MVFAKLRGVFVETSGVFCCVGVVCALVAFSSFSMCSTFSAFVYFGNFCRGEFKICLHIPLWCGGVRGLTM